VKEGKALTLKELKFVTGAAPEGKATVVPQKVLGKLALEPKLGFVALSCATTK
jgi:ribosomal protein L18E